LKRLGQWCAGAGARALWSGICRHFEISGHFHDAGNREAHCASGIPHWIVCHAAVGICFCHAQSDPPKWEDAGNVRHGCHVTGGHLGRIGSHGDRSRHDATVPGIGLLRAADFVHRVSLHSAGDDFPPSG